MWHWKSGEFSSEILQIHSANETLVKLLEVSLDPSRWPLKKRQRLPNWNFTLHVGWSDYDLFCFSLELEVILASKYKKLSNHFDKESSGLVLWHGNHFFPFLFVFFLILSIWRNRLIHKFLFSLSLGCAAAYHNLRGCSACQFSQFLQVSFSHFLCLLWRIVLFQVI